MAGGAMDGRMDWISLIVAAALLLGATPNIAARTGEARLVTAPLTLTRIGYGPDPRQTIGLFRRGTETMPLIVYLHGGGWSAGTPAAGEGSQAEHFTRTGHAYATIGYRFVGTVRVEDQLAEIAGAIARLARMPGIDGRRIVLIGHSSGGHLAAMLGADPQWLERAGVPLGAVRGVVLLDPAALDVTAILGSGARGGAIDAFFRPAFGDDPARQWALSPLAHAAAPNAAGWLMLHDVANPGSGWQCRALARDLVRAGAGPVYVQPIAGTSHVRLNDEIGRPLDPATAQIDAFLDQLPGG